MHARTALVVVMAGLISFGLGWYLISIMALAAAAILVSIVTAVILFRVRYRAMQRAVLARLHQEGVSLDRIEIIERQLHKAHGALPFLRVRLIGWKLQAWCLLAATAACLLGIALSTTLR